MFQVAEQLLGGYCGRQRKAKESIPEKPYMSQSAAAMHKATRFTGRSRVCKHCSRSGNKTKGGRTSETTFGCEQCGIHLHR